MITYTVTDLVDEGSFTMQAWNEPDLLRQLGERDGIRFEDNEWYEATGSSSPRAALYTIQREGFMPATVYLRHE